MQSGNTLGHIGIAFGSFECFLIGLKKSKQTIKHIKYKECKNENHVIKRRVAL